MNCQSLPAGKVAVPGTWLGVQRRARVCVFVAWVVLVLALIAGAPAQDLVLTEFMASNVATLADEDGDYSDWIEVQNPGPTAVNLFNWCLTDDPANLAKWRFPATNLAANGYLLVFASQKDRRIAGAPLHTNFKLSSSGEYLALVAPDGTNVVSAFAPFYPPQAPDISYGLGRVTTETVLLEAGASGRVLVPTNGLLGSTWTAPEFVDTDWAAASTGIGFQAVVSTNSFRALIRTDLQTRMYRTNATAYLRLPFVVDDPGLVDHLTLQLKYDDGYIAYLNGVEVSADRAPDLADWHATATEDRPDSAALVYQMISLDSSRGLLLSGTNVLAIQGLNSTNTDPAFLLVPRLVAGRDLTPTNILRYFTLPTPGAANGVGVANLGPIISDTQHAPGIPREDQPIAFTCRISPSFAALAGAAFHYRVMFSNEVSLPLLDDGTQGDGQPGDGTFGAIIPAHVASPGQMVRWYVTAQDAAGHVSRWPGYQDTNNSPQYEGTMVEVTVPSQLTVLHWFVENPALAATDTGTRSSVFYRGEFYDNILTAIRGQASRGYPKKSYKLDFNKGYHFRFDPDRDRVEEMNLMTTSSDKSFLRVTMAYESFRDAGSPWMISFPVRVHQNNAFFSVSIFSEHPDETWMARNGLDPNGAFYKMYNSLETAGGNDKRTRLNEGFGDLQELVTNIAASNTNRVRYLYDNVNLAAMMNYLAVMIVLHDNDAPHKNYWMYRDSDGTGEWRMLPWDKDLSFGMNFNGGLSDELWAANDGSGVVSPSHPFFGDQRHQKVDFQWNRLIEALYTTPPILEMFKRRLRTVMDLLLQPPGTWPTLRKYERRMDYFYSLMKDDVALDRARWPYFFGANMDFATGLDALKQGYLVPRRQHLYITHSVNNPGYAKSALLPEAQPGDAVILLGGLDSNPASGRQDEEYIQLVNTNAYATDISHWRLTSVLGAIDHTFESGTVIPSNSVLYVSPNARAFRARTISPHGGQTNFVQGNYRGHLSARGDTLQLADDRGRAVTALTYPGNPSPAQLYLRITELMYHPSPPPAGSLFTAEDFEYIELKNTGPVPLDLNGVRFTAGVQFDFTGTPAASLAPGQRVVVVKNLDAFSSRYGPSSPWVAGEYLGNLDNGGEVLRLEDAVGEVILEFAYDNRWYPVTDGLGFSLVVADAEADWQSWGSPTNWRPSALAQGAPGSEDPQPAGVPPVQITELLSASPIGLHDTVEIFNPGPGLADLTGWWLTDDFGTPKKFRLPPGSVIPPGAYLLLDETQFDATPGAPNNFAFSSSGDEVYLFAADTGGNLTGYFDGFHFGPAESGVSFGRHITSVGELHYVAQAGRTFGAPNAGPKIGPVIVSEIDYHPPDLSGGVDDPDLEFVELHNVTTADQPLFDPAAATNTWRMRGGIEFDLPPAIVLPPGGFALLVSFDPATNGTALAAFRAQVAPAPDALILGPFHGKLQNSSDRIELLRPNPPIGGAVAYVLVDGVTYRDASPWPSEADGLGLSLQRRQPPAYADDPASWQAGAPTPGALAASGASLTLNLAPADATVMATHDVSFAVLAASTSPPHYQWRFNGTPLVGATSSVLQLTNVQPEQSGSYDVIVFNDSTSFTTPPARLTVNIPPGIALQPQGKVVYVGATYTLDVVAFGTGTLRYQWHYNGADLAGATNRMLLLANAQEEQTGNYSVTITDDVGTLSSQAAFVGIVLPPFITGQMPSQVYAVAGDTVQLIIHANGSLPLSYRWRRNSLLLTNQILFSRTSVLTLPNVQPGNAGIYSVVVTNLAPATNAISSGSTLFVLPDFDGDHMADSWEVAQGFSTNNAADALLDSDGDGVSNLEEFRAGTDPHDPLSFLRVDRVLPAAGATRIQFGAASNKTYSVQYTDLLGDPLWLTVTNVFSRSSNWNAAVVDPGPVGAQRLYRLVTPYQP